MAKRKGKNMTDFKEEETPTRPDVPSVLPPPVSERVPEPAPKPEPEPEAIDIAAYRLAACMLLTYAVDGSHRGERVVGDPVYRVVVEGRIGPKYSSCGDLAHWMLYRLGVRAPFVNRAEFREYLGGHGWRVGLNLNLLVPPPIGTCPVAIRPSKLEAMPDVQAGDLLQISNVYGGHQVCVSGREDTLAPDGSPVVTLTTAEYGQPGGKQKHHVLQLISGSLFLGANHVVSWLPLPAALALPGRVAPDLGALKQAQAGTVGLPAPAL